MARDLGPGSSVGRVRLFSSDVDLRVSRFEPSGLVWVSSLDRYIVVSDETGVDRARPWLFTMSRRGVIDPEPLVIEVIENGTLDDVPVRERPAAENFLAHHRVSREPCFSRVDDYARVTFDRQIRFQFRPSSRSLHRSTTGWRSTMPPRPDPCSPRRLSSSSSSPARHPRSGCVISCLSSSSAGLLSASTRAPSRRCFIARCRAKLSIATCSERSERHNGRLALRSCASASMSSKNFSFGY